MIKDSTHHKCNRDRAMNKKKLKSINTGISKYETGSDDNMSILNSYSEDCMTSTKAKKV